MKPTYTEKQRKTKEIYISQHKNYSKDKNIFKRFLDFAEDPKSYGVKTKNFFEGKSILDAGCGNTGYFQVAMHNLGASSVTCLDIGKEWITELKKTMNKFKIPKNFINCVEGSTSDLPFENNSFDFVASNGVIMHLETVQEASIAIKELSRVTANGGHLYVYSGLDKPGIMDKYIIPALRQAYLNEEKFKSFIDNIDHNNINKDIIDTLKKSKKFDDSISENLINMIPSLITLDTTTFFQNILQVPIQQGPKLDYEWIVNQLEINQFSEIKRIPEKYWKRNDFRKFLAPFHYNKNSKLSELFWGGGHVKVIGRKKIF